MDYQIKSYIDNQIIREYAYKSKQGYSLWSDDIEKNELENLVDFLFAHDEETQNFMHGRIQQLLNERLPLVEAEDAYDKGLVPVQDKKTGEVSWTKRI
jgi:hypothetical protein